MRLPEDFPHTRREQYVVTLPEELRSGSEHLEAAVVHHRLTRHYEVVRDKALIALIDDGWTGEDITRALRRHRLPPAFYAPAEESWDLPHRKSLLPLDR